MLVPDLICEIDRRRSVVHHGLTYLHIFTWPFSAKSRNAIRKIKRQPSQTSPIIILMLGKCVRKKHPRTPHALAKFSAGFAGKLFTMFAQAYRSRPINNQ